LGDWLYATGEKIVPYSIRKYDYKDFDTYVQGLNEDQGEPGHVPATTLFCLDVDRDILSEP
jgi:hypothetical protein